MPIVIQMVSPYQSNSFIMSQRRSLPFAIAFKQLFQMNYQQHRNPPLNHSHSQQYATPYHILDPPNNPPHLPFPNLERQSSSKGNLLKLPFNGYSEMKEYFRPQQTTVTTPLTFNMQSPSKLKAKKTNRPASKVANKSYNSPFTQELQQAFFKNQPTLHHSPLEDFSKTTSSVNGNSFLNFNLHQTFTEPNDDRIYTPLKFQSDAPQANKITHSNSLKILFQREPENKPYTPNLFNHSNSTYFPKPAYEPSSATKPRENPSSSTAYLLDQKFLLDEIKSLKEMNEKYQKETMRLNMELNKATRSNEAERKDELRGSRKENKFQTRQLELKLEQNNKLLVQIEDMEKDLKGKVQLNRYLEHQCNTFNEKYEEIRRQFDSFKAAQGQERSRQEETLSSLRKHIAEVQNQANILRINCNTRQGQTLQLKKALQLQGQKLQQLLTNNQIDKSQINVLTKRLENFQTKYEKLMLSHCQTEGKLRDYEEALIQAKKRQELFAREMKGIEAKLKQANEQKEALRIQLVSLREEVVHLENRATEMKNCYSEQYSIIKQDLSETNKIVESKTKENQHLRLKIENKAKQNQEIQHKLRQTMQVVEELRKRTLQKATLQTLLEQKSTEIQLLQGRQKSLQDDYIKISCQIEQRNTLIADQASQIEEIKTKIATVTSEKGQIGARYDSLRGRFEQQSFHMKELQSNLAKQDIQNKILQSELGEYSSQCSHIHEEYDELRKHYDALQSQHIQNLQNFALQSEALQSKNKELATITQEKQVQVTQLQKQKFQVQAQIHEAEENLIKMNQIKLLCSQYQQRLKYKSQQSLSHLQNIQQLQQKYTLVQTQYSQLLLQSQSASQARQAELSSSSKSEVQTWQLLSRKEVQIQSLLNKIQILEEKLQSKTDQLHGIEQKTSKEEMLRLEIQELMMIVEQNQKHSQEEKEGLTKINEGLKVEIKALQQKNTDEGLEYNNMIVELKASIQALQTEYANLSHLPSKTKMKTSILQGEELQLKQWNSLSEFQSFDSIEDTCSPRKIESAEELLQQVGEVAYIEMDGEGVSYLCQLLQIDATGGNILSQIVVRVENFLNQVQLSRKVSQSYREVLQAFGVQEGVGSGGKLMGEITNFKESLGLVIQQLKEQQLCSQALRGQCCQLRLIHEGELVKGQRMMQELHLQGELTNELNQIILSLNAKLTNQRLIMAEAMTLAKLSVSERPLTSEKFVTARSIADIPACQSSPLGESDIE